MAIQDFTAGQVLTAAQMDSLQANDYNWTVSTKTASYVLVAADKGTRVVMNAAGATTITVNTSLFSAGDTLFIQNIGAGTCTITAGTATVTTAGSLALAQWGGGTLYFTSASAAIFFSGGPPTYGTATGGIGAPTAVTISGVNYQYLTFNSTGTLTVTRNGFFDYLLIGGGNGAMKWTGSSVANGGGGAGQVVFGSIYLNANQTITIGAGSSTVEGSTGAPTFNEASNSSIAATSPFTQTALGSTWVLLITGQSYTYTGGGLGSFSTGGAAAAITESLARGYRGGSSVNTTSAGGGGGQSGRGGNGSGTTGGVGGTGVDISTFIGGSASYRATGGGGAGTTAGGAGGNSSASSNAGSTTTTANSAAANSGSGGGAGLGATTGGNGGSGVCFIRWKV